MTLVLLLVDAAGKWVMMEEIAPLYMSESWMLFTGDGPDEARKLEKFEWVWVSSSTPLGNGSRWRDGAAVHVGHFGVVHR